MASGCASIISGTTQSVSVVTKTKESLDIVGASCTPTNNKGEWYATTPGSVVVHRSFGELAVKCVHPGYAGVTRVESSTKGMAFGNLIFGGPIGAGVDMANGSAYDYPQTIPVMMASTLPVAPVVAAPAAVAAPVAPAVVVAPAVAVAPVVATQMPSAVVAPAAAPAQTNIAVPPAAAPIRTPLAPAPLVASAATEPFSQSLAADDRKSLPTTAKLSALKGGQDAFNAEKIAKTKSCSSQPLAVMTGKGPGFEAYSVPCDNGDSMAIRCEFGNCRILQ